MIKAIKKRSIILSILLFLSFILFFGNKVFFEFPDIVSALDGKLKLAQQKSIEILIDLNKLLMTYAMAIIGALSYYVKEGKKAAIPFNMYELVLILCIGILSVLSMYFGYLTISNIVEMLANDYLIIMHTVIIWPVRLQYISLGFASIILLWFTFEIQNKDTGTNEKHKNE